MADSYEKFSFDREFAADGTILRDNTGIKKILTEDEAAAQAQAAAQAALQGEEAKAAHARADALRQVGGRLQIIVSQLKQQSEQMRVEAVQLALTAAQVLAGKALEQYGDETLKSCIEEALEDLRSEPRVAIRLNPTFVDALTPELEQMGEQLGFDGELIIRADEDLPVADCVLEWRNGAIERSHDEILQKIQAAAEKWLAAPSADEAEGAPELDQASGL